MPHDFLPAADSALNAWARNFDAQINFSPASYGLTAGDASAFHVLAQDFSVRLATAIEPDTRTRSSVAAKNSSRAALKKSARQLAKIINAHPGVSDEQRIKLGLAARQLAAMSVPPPATRPMIVLDHTGRVRIVDETLPNRRGRPAGVLGAILFAKLDGPPPTDPRQTWFAGLVTRNSHAIALPENSAGRTLWVMARWVNGRGEEGPVSKVVGAMMAA